MTDQKNDELLRRLIPGPDGQSPVWLYPDGSHRAITRLDVSDINATLASTRTQPVADDAGGDEFKAAMTRVIAIAKSYRSPSNEGNYKGADESNRRAIEYAEQLLKQPPAADNRGVNVALEIRDVLNSVGLLDEQVGENKRLLSNLIEEHLTARGLLRTTPEDGKGVILGYLHEVIEPDGQYHKMYSAQEESPWKHWKEDHQAGCRYKRTALFGATPQPEHEVKG